MLGPEPGHTQTPCGGNGHRPCPTAQTPGSGQGTPSPPKTPLAGLCLGWKASSLGRSLDSVGPLLPPLEDGDSTQHTLREAVGSGSLIPCCA